MNSPDSNLSTPFSWYGPHCFHAISSTNSVIPKFGDALTLNKFPLENSDAGHSSIQILLVLVEEFFNQDQISLFGMIKFIPNSIEIAVSVSDPTFEGSSGLSTNFKGSN